MSRTPPPTDIDAPSAAADDRVETRLVELGRILRDAPVGLAMLDLGLRYRWINRWLADGNGAAVEAHLGRTVREMVPGLADQADAVLQRILETGAPCLDVEFTGELPTHPGVERIWFEQWHPLRDGAGAIAGVGLVVEDVTERRRVERENAALLRRVLGESERLHGLFRQAPGFICILRGPEHRFEFVNDAYLRVFGPRELVGRTVREGFPDIAGQGFHELLDHVYRSGERFVASAMPVSIRDGADGSTRERYLDFVYEPMRDARGEVSGIFCEGHDVTDRVLGERAMREGEARLRAVVDNLPGGAAFVVDADMRYRHAGGEAFTQAGLHAGDFVGRTIFEALPKDLAAHHEPRLRQTLAGEPFVEEHVAHGRHFVSRGVPLRGADGDVQAALVVSYDITERRRAEAAVARSEQRYRTLFEAIDEGFCVIRMVFDDHARPVDYVFLEVNPAFERHTGMVDAVGRSMREFVPEHEDRWFDIYGRVALTGEPIRFEQVAQALGPRWFDLYAFRIGDPDEHTVAVLFSDVTEHRRLLADLREADARKDEFLAMLGHELRNPLVPIVNALRVIERTESPTPRGREALAMIGRQTTRMQRLVDDLLEVSRISLGKIELRLETVSVATLVHQAADAVASECEARGQRMLVFVPPEPMRIRADPVRLSQVLENLLNNAVKYTPDGGTIRIEAGSGADAVEIRVVDDGIGIAPAQQRHLFELFHQVDATLDRSRGGLGIGLALVQRLVELHGGSVSVASEGLGKGSTFTVRLPRGDAGAPG